MKSKSATRRALLSSAVSLVLCFTMLLGTTFAWFTDSASTAVNTIQSGTLDVVLEYWNGTEWEDAQGQTLSFKKAANAPANEQILWEPGCTYKLPAIRVGNKGNLYLKYQIAITGIDGDAKLNEAIEWSYTVEGTTNAAAFDGDLAPNAYTDGIVITGHMKEEAGNEYQDLTIDGISITVYATQKDAEFDSFNNEYDKPAYEVGVTPDVDWAKVIREAADGAVIYMEPGEYTLDSVIVIEDKDLTIVGQKDVKIVKNFGNSHIFTVKHNANVTLDNLTLDGNGLAREGIYVRNNSDVILKNVTIGNTGGIDIMVDEASDAAHGLNTASTVSLYNSSVEDVALCASPVTTVAATQDTYVYFNYDADSSIGSIEKQSINLKPENIYINGDNGTGTGVVKYLNVTNDAELAEALNTIKTDSSYWAPAEVVVNMAAGEYSADHVFNQYPEWNGTVGAGSTANNYASGVAGKPFTNVTFVGESASTFARGASAVPQAIFTGNLTVNGFGNAGTGFGTAVAKTTFQNIGFDAANSADNAEDSIVLYVKAAANNVNFVGCTFENATHVTLGGAAADGVGTVNFDGCTFNDGGCLSGYVETLNVSDSTVTAAKNGFINKSKAGTVTVENCDITAGRYFIRTSNSGVELTVKDSEIEMYESEGTKHLVYFRGSNESAKFTDCEIADGYTTAGVDADSSIEIYNYSEIDGITYIEDGVSGTNTLYLVPSDYEGTTVTVAEGTTAIGNYAFAYNNNVEEVILASTVRDLGRGFDSNTGIKKVVLNEGLTSISSRAFKSTATLEEVVISSTVKVIEDNAFQKSGIKSIVIPATVETVGETAFGASLIEEVTFEGNTSIQGYAFRGCTELRTVNLEGDDVTFIPSTLNGRNSTWFCNGESNNPNTSNITFNVVNETVAARVKAAMGAEAGNTPVYVNGVLYEN